MVKRYVAAIVLSFFIFTGSIFGVSNVVLAGSNDVILYMEVENLCLGLWGLYSECEFAGRIGIPFARIDIFGNRKDFKRFCLIAYINGYKRKKLDYNVFMNRCIYKYTNGKYIDMR